MKTNTTTAAKLLEVSRQLGLSLPEVMLRRERELNETPPEVVYEKLRVAYGIMRQAVEESLREPHKTMGGLIGGEARKLAEYRAAGKNLCGETVSRAICYAMGVLEVSASMGLIVAAPTAGASGVLPGVLIALQEQYGLTERQMLDALLVASAIGVVVAENSGISGAAGGCQAEVGTASAMAAASSVYLMGAARNSASRRRDWPSKICWGWYATPLPGWWRPPARPETRPGLPMPWFPPSWCWPGCRRSFPLMRWWRRPVRWAMPYRKVCGRRPWAALPPPRLPAGWRSRPAAAAAAGAAEYIPSFNKSVHAFRR